MGCGASSMPQTQENVQTKAFGSERRKQLKASETSKAIPSNFKSSSNLNGNAEANVKSAFDALMKGNIEKVKGQIKSQVIPVSILGTAELNYYIDDRRENEKLRFESASLLHVAAASSLTDFAKFLLDRDCDVDGTCRVAGRALSVTPLHLACYNGNLDLVKLLIEYGANTNMADTEHNANDALVMQRPVHLAARNKHLQVLKYLLKQGADAEARFRVKQSNGSYITRGLTDMISDPSTIDVINRAIAMNYVDPENCVVFGAGITPTQVTGKQTEFTILTRDKFKEFKKKGGDNFRVRFDGFIPLTSTVPNWHVNIIDNHNGSYTVQYIPPQPGRYSMHISLVNFLSAEKKVIPSADVGKSPYRIVVEASAEPVETPEVIQAMVPVRFHVGGVIMHFAFPARISLEELRERISNEFDITNPNFRLKYSAGGKLIPIYLPDDLENTLDLWKRSNTPKFEMYCEQ